MLASIKFYVNLLTSSNAFFFYLYSPLCGRCNNFGKYKENWYLFIGTHKHEKTIGRALIKLSISFLLSSAHIR